MLTLKKKLGNRIKVLRKKEGLTQEKLSEILEMDVPNLSNIECGKRFMTAETLEKIAKALNTTERELFDFREFAPSNYLESDIIEIIKSFNNKELKFVLDFLKSYKEFKNNP